MFLGGSIVAFGVVVLGSLLRVPVPPGGRQWLVAVAAVALLAREFGLLRFPLPQNARQVPQFVTRVPFWGSLQFGTEMGTGVRTYSPTGLPHLIAMAVLLLASWPEALTAGVGFALGRSLMTLGFLAARDRPSADNAFLRTVPRLRWVFAFLMGPAIAVLVLGA